MKNSAVGVKRVQVLSFKFQVLLTLKRRERESMLRSSANERFAMEHYFELRGFRYQTRLSTDSHFSASPTIKFAM